MIYSFDNKKFATKRGSFSKIVFRHKAPILRFASPQTQLKVLTHSFGRVETNYCYVVSNTVVTILVYS